MCLTTYSSTSIKQRSWWWTSEKPTLLSLLSLSGARGDYKYLQHRRSFLPVVIKLSYSSPSVRGRLTEPETGSVTFNCYCIITYSHPTFDYHHILYLCHYLYYHCLLHCIPPRLLKALSFLVVVLSFISEQRIAVTRQSNFPQGLMEFSES